MESLIVDMVLGKTHLNQITIINDLGALDFNSFFKLHLL